MADRKSDIVRILHMYNAAKKAVKYTQFKNRYDLDKDEQLSLALVRLIEIIGEAASKVTQQTKTQYTEIPWKNIVGTRNRIIHAYEDVDYDILWQIISADLPALINQLEIILKNINPEDQQKMF